jgi:hypothetical protein
VILFFIVVKLCFKKKDMTMEVNIQRKYDIWLKNNPNCTMVQAYESGYKIGCSDQQERDADLAMNWDDETGMCECSSISFAIKNNLVYE